MSSTGWFSPRLLAALAPAALAGWLLATLHAPLPWLLGPMLVIAGANGLHARVVVPKSARFGGQWLVGAALGLYFTVPVLTVLAHAIGWIALAVLLSFGVSAIAARVFARVGRTDPVTAFFATSVGGAAEMANLAERYGARVDQVAAAQALRVLTVVLVLPFLFRFADLHGSDAYAPVAVPFAWPGLGLLLASCGVAGAVLHLLRVPNAWLFGPLLVSTAWTAGGEPLSSVPAPLVNVGQWLIGCSLGARFAPEFFRESPRFLLGVAAGAVVLLLGCAGVGLVISLLSGIPPATAVLATAPGGLAEMGLTAKALQLGVPMVTAFHTVRLVSVVLSAGPVFRVLQRRSTQRNSR